MNLVRLLTARGKLDMIFDIVGEYQHLLDTYYGVEPARVTTAVPLDEDVKQKLAGELSNIIGKNVIIESEVDPGVLGGIVVRVGGKLLDGSTRSRLISLKKELVGLEKRN